MDPDPGGPKTCGSGGSGSGTLDGAMFVSACTGGILGTENSVEGRKSSATCNASMVGTIKRSRYAFVLYLCVGTPALLPDGRILGRRTQKNGLVKILAF
jgi:hypothetical protein